MIFLGAAGMLAAAQLAAKEEAISSAMAHCANVEPIFFLKCNFLIKGKEGDIKIGL